MKIELKKLKHYEGMSQETNAFSADLYVDGKLAATCRDDGNGGCIGLYTYDSGCEKGLLDKAEDYCRTLPPYIYTHGSGKTTPLDMNLELFIGLLVEDSLKQKANKKLNAKFKKGICYGNENFYTIITWKNLTLEQIMTAKHGREKVSKIIADLISKGENILNTNIPRELYPN